ncbi:MAG: hypothetical protein IPJ13_24515 [Saprospiraceae bacterium]|nr:hypothetical protein [Saprospiraceae bacterium]
MTFTTDFLISVGSGKKLELSLSYSENLGGLQNFVGPQFEIGTVIICPKSICNLMEWKTTYPTTMNIFVDHGHHGKKKDV